MQIKHGELYWIDLRPVVDSYILCKVFNYNVYSDVYKPWFVHVYDCFSVDKDKIPVKEDRTLYLYPLNVSEIQVRELPQHFHYVGVEEVTEDERVNGIKVISGVSFDSFVEREHFALKDVDSGAVSQMDAYTKEEVKHLGFLGREFIYYIRDRIFIEYFKKNNNFQFIPDEHLDSPSDFMAKWEAYKDCILYSEDEEFYNKPIFKVDPIYLSNDMVVRYNSNILRVISMSFYHLTHQKLLPLGIVPTSYLLLNILHILVQNRMENFKISLPMVTQISAGEFRLKVEEVTASKLSELILTEILHEDLDIEYYLNHPKINTFGYEYDIEKDEKYLVEYEYEI